MPSWGGKLCQADVICKMLSAGQSGALKHVHPLVPRQTLLWNLAKPYYEGWGCIGKSRCDRHQRLQNRAGKIITFKDYNTRSADMLQDLGWDTLNKDTLSSFQLGYTNLWTFYVLWVWKIRWNQPLRFTHTMYKDLQTTFLCPYPVQKLLREHLPGGGGLGEIFAWGNFCWVCAAGMSEHQPRYSQFLVCFVAIYKPHLRHFWAL